ncbi:MAG: hypothetical protein ACK58L_08020 [Planctomycetota bacterium]
MRVSGLQIVVLVTVCGIFSSGWPPAYGRQQQSSDKHKEIPASAKPTKIVQSDGISCWQTESALYVQLNPPRTSGEIRLPRLANVVSKVHWLGHAEAALHLHPEPTHWIVKFDQAPEDASTIVVQLDSTPVLFDAQRVIEPSEDDCITLDARYAVTHGNTLRYEPQSHKNTVGYWSNEKDSVSWKFRCDKAGVYEVDILQGCGKGHGGSDVDLRIGRQTLRLKVQETGHFQNFVWKTPGEVMLPEAADLTLELVPAGKAAGAVMDVRAIRLVPQGRDRVKTPELADPEALPKVP